MHQPVGTLNQLLKQMIQAMMFLIQGPKAMNQRPNKRIQDVKVLNQVLKKMIQRTKMAQKTASMT